MTLVNVILVGLVCEAAGLIFSFPSVIENARRAARDSQRGHFRTLGLGSQLESALDFVDSHYSHYTVTSLKTARASLITLLFAAVTFWILAYYVAATLTPSILAMATAAAVGPIDLQAVDNELNRIPSSLYVAAGVLEVLIFVSLCWISVRHDLPQTLWRVMNPPAGDDEEDQRMKRSP